MTTPEEGQQEPNQHPIIGEVANWVIDLTDPNSIPEKRFLRDATAPGEPWIDSRGKLQVPLQLYKYRPDDGSLEVLTAQSDPEGGEATLNHIPVEDIYL